MSSYIALMNQHASDIDDLVVGGTIDFSDATLIGFPTDDITIRVNDDGKIEVLDGSITIAKVTGTDLWTRILSDETNITTLQNKTQYLTAAGNVSTFTGSISVPALTVDIPTIGVSDVGTILFQLLARTNWQAADFVVPVTVFSSALHSEVQLAAPAIILAGVDLNTRLTNIESVNTTQNTNINSLITKTQVQTLSGTGPSGFTTSWNCMMLPNSTNFFDLGSSAYRWNTLYIVTIFCNGIDVGALLVTHDSSIAAVLLRTQYQTASTSITTFTSHLNPNISATWDLGTNLLRWRTLHVGSITLNGTDLDTRITSIESTNTAYGVRITALETKTQYQTTSLATTSWSSALIPTTDNTRDLGSPALEWRRIYSHELWIDGIEIVSRDGGKLSLTQSFIPNPTDTYDLGTATYRWRTLYSSSIILAGTNVNTRLTNVETTNTTQNTNISLLQGKTTNFDATNAGVRVTVGPTDVNGDALLLDLYGLSYTGVRMYMRAQTGGYTQFRTRNNNTFNISHSGFAVQQTMSSTGFVITGSSYCEKPTGTTWSNPSDSRIKKNIQRERTKLPGLREINQLELTSWEFNDDAENGDDEVHIGFIADEVAKVFPKACKDLPHKKFGTIKGLDCSDLIMALFPAVQELSAKLDSALTRIKFLENELGFEPNAKRQTLVN